MTSIYQRKDKRWVAQYTDATGKQKYLYVAKRKDVKDKLDKVLEDQRQGLKQGADKLTLSEYLEDWLSATTGTVAESSHALRKLYARKHIAPALGHIKLSDLDAMTVQTFYQQKHAAGMLPQTVKRMHATPSELTHSGDAPILGDSVYPTPLQRVAAQIRPKPGGRESYLGHLQTS